ncbi:MAG: glycoside hydrolase family 92 protein [Clostridia bacterium]|nr:glycoside hydrolase family 92 protein [Clostridia bacterium]
MTDQDVCKYVDVFYGNGETDRFFEDGLASKWFYIKALCGNTTPHAVLPFGKMSVGAYSGAYSSGYGTHLPNSCGGIRKLSDTPVAKGFSHLHQSGTGAMRYYYNYAVTAPFYGDDLTLIHQNEALKEEDARPGYYKAKIRDVLCELTVDKEVALHRYTFEKSGGRIAIDFSNDGLEKSFGVNHSSLVKNAEIKIVSDNSVSFSGEFSGVRLYFHVKAECVGSSVKLFSKDKILNETTKAEYEAPFGAVFDFEGNSVLLRVGYSTLCAETAMAAVNESTNSFEEAEKEAYHIWNEHLGGFEISTPSDELKQKFYSCLYHSIIKPCDMTGEEVLGVRGDTVTDFATFWDQYKTVLPLIYMCYPKMGERIAKAIVNISRTLNKIPCSFGLSSVFPCEEQAKMLGIYALCDAFHFGYECITPKIIEECTERELSRDDYKGFLDSGIFERYTHILDVADACADVAEIAENEDFKDELLKISECWKNAYSKDGLMSEDSEYYEGDRYTYSFRIQRNMEERVALCGGKARFASMLDSFFGFRGDSVKQFNYVDALADIKKSRHHRFEGFNNECDMEAPYAYIYADRHDKLCEILHECVNRSFGLGKSALPGNNDSGGLTSAFIWNALGLFPVSGSGEFLIGSPQIEGAKISLRGGKVLEIKVHRQAKEQIYVDRVTWRCKAIDNYRISVSELMGGGELCFYMK